MKERSRGVRVPLIVSDLQFLGVVEQLLIVTFQGNCTGALMKYPFFNSEKRGLGCSRSANL